ncbi:MAG TPA: family 1 encapsulin nanocompartment shell protein [Chloroflexota bacterium]|nr:family 1 encapsulin nanocompartment shell protein [Chloroflexota bacterium]
MADFLGRDQSPLTDDQWAAFDETVVSVAHRTLVGRRLISMFGPLGPGAQVAPNDVFLGRNEGVVDTLGEEVCDEIRAGDRRYLPLPIIHKDFMFHWRDLAAAGESGLPLDTGAVASAAAYCARSEDELIFRGNADLGYSGLLNMPDHLEVRGTDWDGMGNAFRDVVAAAEQLASSGFPGPFALAVSTRLYVAMNRMFENTGVLEIDQIKKIVAAGVFVSPVIGQSSAVVVATGPENLDLVVGVDMTTAYIESSRMNHHFRVLETLVLRIKRPEAICVITAGPEA